MFYEKSWKIYKITETLRGFSKIVEKICLAPVPKWNGVRQRGQGEGKKKDKKWGNGMRGEMIKKTVQANIFNFINQKNKLILN